MTGDKNFDGTPRPPRFGLMTFVAEELGRTWKIAVAPGRSPDPLHRS